MKTLANGCFRNTPVHQHLNNAHKEQASKSIEYFKCKEGYLKRDTLDARSVFNQAISSIIEASYVVAICIAEEKKFDTIAETLVKPRLLDCVNIVLDDRTCNKLKQVSLHNDTINSIIVEMSSDTVVTSSALSFAIRLDEPTDVANLLQLLYSSAFAMCPAQVSKKIFYFAAFLFIFSKVF